MRRDRRTCIPVHVHAPAQCVHHLRVVDALIAPREGPLSFAFGFTHWVSLPNQSISAPLLDSRSISGVHLPFLG